MRILVIAALVLMGLGATAFVQAQEKKLERKDLPAAVRTAVDRESAGATVKDFRRKERTAFELMKPR